MEGRRGGTRRILGAGMRRLAIYPFEAAVAVLLFVSGISGLLKYGVTDPVSALLPMWLAVTLNVMTTLTGGLMLAGTMAGERRAELAGLLFLIGVVTCRFILFGVYFGFGSDFVTTGIFYTAIICAALVRLSSIRRGLMVVRIRNERSGL